MDVSVVKATPPRSRPTAETAASRLASAFAGTADERNNGNGNGYIHVVNPSMGPTLALADDVTDVTTDMMGHASLLSRAGSGSSEDRSYFCITFGYISIVTMRVQFPTPRNNAEVCRILCLAAL